MKTFQIKKGVPLPDVGAGKSKKYDWPFDKMKVGDHFIVQVKDTSELLKMRPAITSGAYAYRSSGLRIAQRLVSPTELGVWRVK